MKRLTHSNYLSKQAHTLAATIIDCPDFEISTKRNMLMRPQDYTSTLLALRQKAMRQIYGDSTRSEEWLKLMVLQLTKHFTAYPDQLPDEEQSGSEPTEETTNHKDTTMARPDYSSQPVANPTLVYGTDVASMSEAELISSIKGIKAQMKADEELGIESARIDQLQAGRLLALQALVAALDKFVVPVAAPAATPAPTA